MADQIDKILAAVVKADSLDLKKDPNHRLQGSFVWNRAHTLLDDDKVPSTILSQRVQAEYALIKQYIDSKLGHDRKSGPLLPVRGGTGDKSPPTSTCVTWPNSSRRISPQTRTRTGARR